MTDLFILNDRNEPVPLPESDLLRWGRWLDVALESGRRVVGHTQVGDFVVTTLFGGCDQNWENGPPVLFETTVRESGERRDLLTRRYETWGDAEIGHEEVCKEIDGREPTAD